VSEGENLVERIRRRGVRGAAPVDLIAIGLSRRIGDAVANEEMARDLLKRFGSVARIAELSYVEIGKETGLEEFEILRCLALLELGRKAGQAEKGKRTEVDIPEDVLVVIDHIRYERQEHFVVVLLDAKNRVIRSETVHIGTLTSSIVGPREVFSVAVRESASSIIVAHNHPSGDPSPSPQDIEVTKRLVEVGKILDIPVVDHLILGDPGLVSFHRKGLI
jgi:DNA repair protein RadC